MTTQQQQRERFEKRYPKPDKIFWFEDELRYSTIHKLTVYERLAFFQYEIMWSCYQSGAEDKQAEIDELKRKLEKYGRHDKLCAIVGGYGYCTCGLDAAIIASGATVKAGA